MAPLNPSGQPSLARQFDLVIVIPFGQSLNIAPYAPGFLWHAACLQRDILRYDDQDRAWTNTIGARGRPRHLARSFQYCHRNCSCGVATRGFTPNCRSFCRSDCHLHRLRNSRHRPKRQSRRPERRRRRRMVSLLFAFDARACSGTRPCLSAGCTGNLQSAHVADISGIRPDAGTFDQRRTTARTAAFLKKPMSSPANPFCLGT